MQFNFLREEELPLKALEFLFYSFFWLELFFAQKINSELANC